MVACSDEEIAASLDATHARHDPAADGVVRGWLRRLCMWLEMRRGGPANPGLMLALDHPASLCIRDVGRQLIVANTVNG